MKDKTDLVKLAKDAISEAAVRILLTAATPLPASWPNSTNNSSKLNQPAKSVGWNPVTLQGKDLLLSKVPEAVHSETGIDVHLADRRGSKTRTEPGNGAVLAALDQVAKAETLCVAAPCDAEDCPGPPGRSIRCRPAHSGLFRIGIRKVNTFRDLDTRCHSRVAKLEIVGRRCSSSFLLEMWSKTFVLEDDMGHNEQMAEPHNRASGAEGDREVRDRCVPAGPSTRRASASACSRAVSRWLARGNY